MPGRAETVLQQGKKKKKKEKKAVAFYLHISNAIRETPQRLSLKAKLTWHFGFPSHDLHGEGNNAGAALIGRDLVSAEQLHPTFFP